MHSTDMSSWGTTSSASCNEHTEHGEKTIDDGHSMTLCEAPHSVTSATALSRRALRFKSTVAVAPKPKHE